VEPVSPNFVAAQMEAVLSDLEVGARRLAHSLDMPHLMLDLEEEFRRTDQGAREAELLLHPTRQPTSPNVGAPSPPAFRISSR